VFIRIRGEQHYLCRAGDQVLDIVVQSWRNSKAAKRFSASFCAAYNMSHG
jgi:transposase-like protein